ncbi:hypothetical protein Goshw_016416 [Gossypium schwendimanii]|uniref:DUF7745 domain-containing protein n=1 Tax=Gossypium schwendimanii TaxID=34291 RepID=A0A7J9NBM0_GOSSC|nr:hypothetical protein [Gossypium schwendimanii]
MEKRFLDRVENNAAVRTWAELTQRKKGDSLADGYVSELWDFTRVSETHNNLQELKEIWDQWNNENLILAHPDARKKVDVFALNKYGLVVFPKALRHVDEAVTDLFGRLNKRVTPVPALLAETFRSLSACRRAGEGRFIGCASSYLHGYTVTFGRLIKFHIRSSLKVIHH